MNLSDGRARDVHQTILSGRRITGGRALSRRVNRLARDARVRPRGLAVRRTHGSRQGLGSDQRQGRRMGRPGYPAGRRRPSLPLEPGRLRLGERVLLRCRPRRIPELGRDAVRLLRRVERHHRRQDARLAVGDGHERAHLRRERVEHPGAAGARGGRRGLAPVPHRSPPGWTDGWPFGRRDPGTHTRRDPDVPLQQPGRAAHPPPGSGHVRHRPRTRCSVHALAAARRRMHRLRIPGQDAPGIPRDPGLRIGLSRCGTHNPVATNLAGGRSGARRRRLGGLVDRAGHALASGCPPVHWRLADEQHLGSDPWLQRLRAADRR